MTKWTPTEEETLKRIVSSIGKTNESGWRIVSSLMEDNGYMRSNHACKAKWRRMERVQMEIDDWYNHGVIHFKDEKQPTNTLKASLYILLAVAAIVLMGVV